MGAGPGQDPVHQGSELQNAETAAWGRAIVAALAGDTKRIASREEVQNRRRSRPTTRLIAAKVAVKEAWESIHTEWDPDAMRDHYEQQTALKLDDATAADLQNYARSLLS